MYKFIDILLNTLTHIEAIAWNLKTISDNNNY